MSDQGYSQLTSLHQHNEDIAIEATVVKPRHVRFARVISTVLNPVSVSLPFVLLVVFYHAQNQLAALIYALIALFFLSVGPLIYVMIGVRTGKLSDFDLSHRSQRAGPFLFGIISTSIGLAVLSLLHGPRDLETALLLTVITAIVLMVTTLWWKISLHASTMAGAATVLTALYGIALLPSFLLLVLVSWSRVVLRRHTVAQVVAGALLSIFLSLVILKLRGI
ncbi:MAG TPA: phosphatase PAP2 family protein [Ktedonobacteraceae bacterium]|nr:phosphatase PAP2 family protein [Ktedonobacteraceae bacterium]